ncbi:MAG: 4-hydroxy-tetrahydrodipicolinate synthase [Bacteroidaceae bacterium]|nr:4-hydroxy-tetrahydrodipicolinate synthase [Bacteroidaceae bacterium]
MTRKRLTGMGVALVTPFTEAGEVDYVALDRLVQSQLDEGTDFLCVLGTTAETPTLTTEEKRNVRKCVIDKVAGRLPILLGVGGNCTQSLINELLSEDFTGVDAILSVTPFYNKPSQEGLYRHYRALAAATQLPIYMYNVPGRTGVNLLPDTVVRLATECPNIVGVKEASGSLAQIKEIIDRTPEGFDVLSGDDGLVFDIIKLGGVGAVTVFGNAYPGAFAQMTHLAMEGKLDEAARLNEAFGEVCSLLFADGNPAGVKVLMSHQGKMGNNLRLPLAPARKDVDEAMLVAMKKLDAYLAAK